MYYVNPSTYWWVLALLRTFIRDYLLTIDRIGGVLAATLTGIPIECEPSETGHFNPPPGQTCRQYAGDFARAAGGYLLNPNANNDCQYCPYSVGDQFLSTLNIQASEKWRDFGIFLIFVCTNWMLVYFFIYTVRIRGWSFGFGYLFGALGKLVAIIKKPFKGVFSKKEE
jgi:ABC-type multidrug transport system permease subunit